MLQTGSDSLERWMHDWLTPAPTTYQGSDTLAFQRWFKFKEAFSPHLVRSIIDRLPRRPRHILDCCAGSGTTGVVAQFAGIDATLIEVNPFLADLIESKLDCYTDTEFHLELSRLLGRGERISVSVDELRKRLPPTFVEPGVNERWLFNRNVAKEIERLRQAIETSRKPKVRRFFRMALASSLIPLSNVRIDGKGRRYRRSWQDRKFTALEVRQHFLDAVARMVQDTYRYSDRLNNRYVVMNEDARIAIANMTDRPSLALFSPPYPNSFDYTDIYNVELWMLGYFSSSSDNIALRQRTLRSHVQTSWAPPEGRVTSEVLAHALNSLIEKRDDLWDHRIPEMIQAYFDDLQILLAAINTKLADDARIAIVIGDSQYADVRINTAQILTDIAHKQGWELEARESARVMRASIQHNRGEKTLDEWLLIFRA